MALRQACLFLKKPMINEDKDIDQNYVPEESEDNEPDRIIKKLESTSSSLWALL